MALGLKKIKLTSEPRGSDLYVQLPEVANASLPTAAAGNEGGIVYDSTNNKVYFSNGSAWAAIGVAGSVGSLDDCYDTGASITVDAGAVTLASDQAAANALIITEANAAGTGSLIDLTHANTAANDIDGTGSSWYVTAAGAATFVSATIPTLSGTTATITTVNATNATITNGTITNLTLGAVDGFTLAGDCTFTTAATTGSGLLIDGSTVTSGNVLRIEADATNLSGGLILACTVDASNVFTVGETGALTITGSASTTCLGITAGNIVLTDGNLTLSAGGAIIVADAGEDAIDITTTATSAAIDITLAGSSNLATGYIDIDGSTGSGPIIDVDFSSTYTGPVLDINMTNAVGASAVLLTGAGTRTVALVSITDTPSTVATFDLNITPANAAANANVFDIDIAGSGDANIIDIAFATTYTAPNGALYINCTNAVGTTAIGLLGAGSRTVPLVAITDVPQATSPTFDLNITPAHANGNLFDIDVAGTGTANIFDVAFAAAYTGNALEINMTNAVGAIGLNMTGAGVRTVAMVNIVDTPSTVATFNLDITPANAAANANVFDIDVAGAGDANIFDLAFAGAYTAPNGAIYLNMTNAVGSTAFAMLGAGVRTVPLFALTDVPADGAATFDINVTGGHANGHTFDIDEDGTSTNNCFNWDCSGAYNGDVINITMANAAATAQAIVVDGSLAASAGIVSFTSSGALANTGSILAVSSTGNLAAANTSAVLKVTETGNAQATSYAMYISSTNNEALLVDTGLSRFDEACTFKGSNVCYLAPNYVAAGGVNNAITVTLTDSDGANVTLAAGLSLYVNLGALTLQAGANTLALNGGLAKSIKAGGSLADIASDYVAGAIVHMIYDGTQWEVMGQVT